jgi:hypothetical protein
MKIREETGADAPEIAALTRAAFGGDYEVSLIEKLRAARLVIVSLVAVQEGAVVGSGVGPRLTVRPPRFCFVPRGIRGLNSDLGVGRGEAPERPHRLSKAPEIVPHYSGKGRKAAEPRCSVWPRLS